MTKHSRKNVNVARKKPITSKEALDRANQQIWQKEFVADYDQIVKRISTAPFNGLNFGQPPPTVS